MAKNPVRSSSESAIPCDICQQSDIDDNAVPPTATIYCSECNVNQCTKCSETHGRLNASKYHKVVNIKLSDNLETECDTLESLEEDLLHENRKEGKDFKRKLEERRKDNNNLDQSRRESTNLEQRLEELRKESKLLEQEFQQSRKESKNLRQELQKSRRETAELKKQNRILKENFDKALDREESLKKEIHAIKSRTESDTFGNVREALTTTPKSNEPQRRHTRSSSESSRLFESKVFVFGIDDGASIAQDIIEINLNRSEVASIVQQIPVEMVTRGSAAAVHGDSIFVTGIGKKCDEIWRFNVTSSEWTKCASFVLGRRGHSAAFVDQVLYICGGRLRPIHKTLDDVEAYDTQKDQCASVGKLVNAVCDSGNCVVFKSSLYIFGGRGASRNIVNEVQVYDTKLNICTLLSEPMPRVRCLFRAVLWENTVILLGYNWCLLYNFETKVWEVKHHFKTDVYYFGLIINNGLVFAIGGGDRKEDADGNLKWICRNDVRCFPVGNILKDEPIFWKRHATLPKPSLVYAFGKMDFALK